MTSKTVPIGGFDYSIRMLPVKTQFHIVKRLAPFIPALMQAYKSPPEDRDVAVFKAGTEALAKMSDADADFVIDKCLSAAQRKIETNGVTRGWADIISPDGGMMFEDIDLLAQGNIVWNVIDFNLVPFLSALQQLSAAESPNQTA